MSNKKSFDLGIILGLLTITFCIVGCCMMFLPLIVRSSDSIVVTYPGLAVVFGGTHDVTYTLTTGNFITSTSVSQDFKFNVFAMLAFFLPLIGGIFTVLNKFVTKKMPFFSIIGFLLIVIGLVLLFFIKSSFNSLNEFDDIASMHYAVGLVLAIVFYGIACLASVVKLFLCDFRK